MKKIAFLLIGILMVSLVTGCGSKTVPTPAEVEVEVQGHNGPIKVMVSFENQTVTGIEILEHWETEGIADPALTDIPKRIIENQSLEVDMITGATVTSKAIVSAVEQAAQEADVKLEGK